MARIWRYDMYHETEVTIQDIVIYCNSVGKALYCFIGLCVYTSDTCLLLPVSDDTVMLERKSQMAEDGL